MVPLIEAKINEVCAEYYAATQDLEPHGENYAETLKRLHALLQEFPNPPFTLQAGARVRARVRVRVRVRVKHIRPFAPSHKHLDR